VNRHHVSRVLPYRPEQLYELVGDVAAYPEFVPWITSMRVSSARSGGPGVTCVDAEAGVGFSFLTERFSTKVTRNALKREIRVELISGPFRRLGNRWDFCDHPMGCRIEFDIDFEFKSRLLGMLLKANFGLAVDRLIACFEGRARALYGEAPVAAAPTPTLTSAAPAAG
jgi:coenzyme Q-binding protein COQ10